MAATASLRSACLLMPFLFLHMPAVPQAAPATPVASQPVPYSQDIFQKPAPDGQLGVLKVWDGHVAGEVIRDKPTRKLLWSFIPNCMFHYGRDMGIDDAMELVLDHSRNTAQVAGGRYFALSGQSGPYLNGRGTFWADTERGIVLGAFFFTPTNGEPSPSLVVFSKQVKEPSLKMSQLPPEFVTYLAAWTKAEQIPDITPRYFIGGNNKRILLEHDEDYCAKSDGSADAQAACGQATLTAADIDMTSAYYLDKIHYATNGTAWMLGPDQTAWLHERDNICGVTVACRIRLARERTRIITRRRG